MKDQFTCVIIDDEPAAIRLLKKYCGKVSFLEVKDTFTNPLEGLKYLEGESVDLVFLDIQMPEITGIQLSKIINKRTKIIFSTAYPQFALDSYEVAALDYLLKPIEFERFYTAVSKIKATNNSDTIVNQTNNDEFFFFKTDGKNKYAKVFLQDIIYIESLKNYIAIHLQDQQIITYNTLKHFKETLPSSNFIQIHKSYIISIKHIDKINNDTIWIQNIELPIGNTYRKSFFETIDNHQL
ncbi:DNA-binding response regulator [Aquimarina sp. AD1]|uniref:LytR/AlgR family response regulator transcription factor n=1 Tax=Aquimarina sp. (strain AD1) TaxID=1714848 RepID=UPI000E4A5CB6|nr:LytTR family DNA-binding domain-containing protein [Aquimarina sp. AD1]AXT55374.1 DNA-binding response regulator [Aquimarina sp. AD1]RKN28701.1 response regulator [Aquimarina sp. AD1]